MISEYNEGVLYLAPSADGDIPLLEEFVQLSDIAREYDDARINDDEEFEMFVEEKDPEDLPQIVRDHLPVINE